MNTANTFNTIIKKIQLKIRNWKKLVYFSKAILSLDAWIVVLKTCAPWYIELSVIWEMKIIGLNWPDMRKCQSTIYNQKAYHQNRTDYEFSSSRTLWFRNSKLAQTWFFHVAGYLLLCCAVLCRAVPINCEKHGKFDNLLHLFCYTEYTPEYLHFFSGTYLLYLSVMCLLFLIFMLYTIKFHDRRKGIELTKHLDVKGYPSICGTFCMPVFHENKIQNESDEKQNILFIESCLYRR